MPDTPEQPLDDYTDRVGKVIEAARRLVRCADEFFPKHPGAVGEALDPLIDAIDALGDDMIVVENPTPADRIERCERAIAELQRAMHAMGVFAPSRELDLIDLP